MDDYKVIYQACGCDFLYGYAESLGEAIELRDKCAAEGWRKIKNKKMAPVPIGDRKFIRR